MMIKYRVSDVAKDFGVPTKEIIELLGKYVQPAKKSATALEEHELDIVFECMTQKPPRQQRPPPPRPAHRLAQQPPARRPPLSPPETRRLRSPRRPRSGAPWIPASPIW